MDQNAQLLLICCEGRTEAEYFRILKEVFRVDQAINIQIFPCNGRQHYALVDSAALKRSQILQGADNGVFQSEDEIETWIVCDRDSYRGSYTKLERYGEDKNVKVAFSDPQFEGYLLQHFGSPNRCSERGAALERKLTSTMIGGGLCEGYTKGNLEWMRVMIDHNFSIAKNAIRNADNFSNHTTKPFFTVQRLAERLLGFADD